MFRQFDIDYNKVTIDGIEIPKPAYLSVGDWNEFWNQFDGEAIEDKIHAAFHEGEEESEKEHEKEHEKEIEDIRRICAKRLDTIFNIFKDSLYDNDLNIDEKVDQVADAIAEGKEEIWRL